MGEGVGALCGSIIAPMPDFGNPTSLKAGTGIERNKLDVEKRRGTLIIVSESAFLCDKFQNSYS